MTCPRCNTNLPDSATFCNNCGAPVQPTRPGSFSYLPPGAPPWPTNPQSLAFRSEEAPTSSRASAQPGLMEKAGIAASDPLAPGSPRPRRSTGSTFAILGIFALSILIGVGTSLGILWANGDLPSSASNAPVAVHLPVATPTAPAQVATPTVPAQAATPTAAATNQLPTPTSFQRISINQLGISLKYPQGWVADAPQITTDSTSSQIHPQQSLGITLFIERFSASSSASIASTNDVNQNNLSQFQNAQGVSNFQTIQPTTPQRTIGGAQWDEQDATFLSTSNGISFHITTIAVQHKQVYYDILYYAPAQYYDEAMQKYFQPMFDSFQFTS